MSVNGSFTLDGGSIQTKLFEFETCGGNDNFMTEIGNLNFIHRFLAISSENRVEIIFT